MIDDELLNVAAQLWIVATGLVQIRGSLRWRFDADRIAKNRLGTGGILVHCVILVFRDSTIQCEIEAQACSRIPPEFWKAERHSLRIDLPVEPRPSVTPFALCGCARQPDGVCSVLQAEASEKSQLDDACIGGLLFLELRSASSSASKLTCSSPAPPAISGKSIRSRSPPCSRPAFRRALSTRIRLIASAAAAKKWPRLSQFGVFAVSTRRM